VTPPANPVEPTSAAPPVASAQPSAATKPEAPPAPADPKPSAEQAKTVDAFAGDWTYDATIVPPGGKPVKTPIGMSCKKVLFGKAASCTMSEIIAGVGPFEGSFLVGFDPLDKTVHFMAITSDDELHDHRCKWTDTKTLACDPLKAGLGGQPITEDVTFTIDTTTASFKSLTTFKDGKKLSFEGANGKKGSLPVKKDPGKAKVPVPTPEQKKTVDAYVGEWKGEGTITLPDGKSLKTPIAMSMTPAAAGKGLTGGMRGTTPMGPFEGAVMVGWDPLDKTLHFMSFTTDDELHDHRCKWSDEKNVVCEPLKAGMNGMPITEDLSFSFDVKQMTFKSVVTMKDGGKMTFEGKATK
jgi:hypothetical protein